MLVVLLPEDLSISLLLVLHPLLPYYIFIVHTTDEKIQGAYRDEAHVYRGGAARLSVRSKMLKFRAADSRRLTKPALVHSVILARM